LKASIYMIYEGGGIVYSTLLLSKYNGYREF
jgi:hypothetical protein